MTNEFWLGFYYGALAGATPLLAFMVWYLNRRIASYLASQHHKETPE